MMDEYLESASAAMTRRSHLRGLGGAVLAVATGQAWAAPEPIGLVLGAAGGASFGGNDLSLSYASSRQGDRLVVLPKMGYLDKLAGGGVITPIHHHARVPFNWGPPTLEVELSNSSAGLLDIAACFFNVRSSRTDPTPIPFIRADKEQNKLRQFTLVNQGWGPMNDAQVEFDLLPGSPAQALATVTRSNTFAHRVRIGSVASQVDVDVSTAFKAMGVDVERLKGGYQGVPPAAWLGQFSNGVAQLVGVLRYNAATAAGAVRSHAVRMVAEVRLVNGERDLLAGGAMPPRYDLVINLPSDSPGHQLRQPMAWSLQGGETRRLSIRIVTPRSAVHEFDFGLVAADPAIKIAPRKVSMTVMVPNGGA